MRGGRAWMLPVVLLALCAAPPANAQTQTRYSLANGCYTLTGVDSAQQVRMQATALGRYLLYRPDHTSGAAQTGGGGARAKDPSRGADWRVDDAGGGAFTPPPMWGGRSLANVRFAPATGCAVYPEAELDATGAPAKGATAFGKVG